MNSNNLDYVITDYISNDLVQDDNHFYSSKLAILDTIGCIFEASSNKEVIEFASKNNLSLNFKNPFKNITGDESYENISWYLTVLTRWFDYNDTFLANEWAHPSDNFGSIFSYFYKNNNHKFYDFVNSLTKAYEIQGSLCLGTSLNKLGYDHVFYVKLASGSVFSHLVNNGDIEAVRNLNVTENFKAIGPDGTVFDGSDAHIEFLTQWFENNAPKWETNYLIANEYTDKDGKLRQWVTSVMILHYKLKEMRSKPIKFMMH